MGPGEGLFGDLADVVMRKVQDGDVPRVDKGVLLEGTDLVVADVDGHKEQVHEGVTLDGVDLVLGQVNLLAVLKVHENPPIHDLELVPR